MGSFSDNARYVELLADFIGVFDDMTDESGHLALHPDSAVGYPEGQSLAQHQCRAGSRSPIYASVRAPAPGGNSLVCFEPHATQSVCPGASWDLVWDGICRHHMGHDPVVVEHSHGFAIRFCHDGGRAFFQVRDADRDLCFHTLHVILLRQQPGCAISCKIQYGISYRESASLRNLRLERRGAAQGSVSQEVAC